MNKSEKIELTAYIIQVLIIAIPVIILGVYTGKAFL